MSYLDDIEVRARMQQLEDALVQQGSKLAEAVLSSVTLRDPLVAALASQYEDLERVYRTERRALMVEVAG